MGRTAIYLVMGTTTILLFFGIQMTSVSTEALENAVIYYEKSQRYNIAVAGANLACNEIFKDFNWRTGFSGLSFNGGTIDVSCADSISGKVLITSVATYPAGASSASSKQKVTVLLNPSNIGKFAMYAGNLSSAAKLQEKDTIDGNIHVNNKLWTTGNAVFIGKATYGSLKTTAGSPTFLGGREGGVNIPVPSLAPYAAAIESSATASGKFQTGGELWLDFKTDGTIGYKNSSGGSFTYVSIGTFTSNGIIAIKDGALHIQGTVKGNFTVAALGTGTTTVENHVQYDTDPVVNPSSTDRLSVVSSGNIVVKEFAPISGKTYMMGNYYSSNTISMENNNNRTYSQLRVNGSLVVNYIDPNEFGPGGNVNKGTNLYLKYDTRNESNPPPYFPFPKTGGFEILSWFE